MQKNWAKNLGKMKYFPKLAINNYNNYSSLRTPWCKLPLLRVRVFFFWCLLAISFSLGTDGMLLALCDHGFERSGKCAEITLVIIIIISST